MADKTGKTWMAAGETDDPNAAIESFEAAVGITKGSPVYLSADDKISPSPGGDDAIGIATKTVSVAEMCPVLKRGRVKVIANGAITRGKAVCGGSRQQSSSISGPSSRRGGSRNLHRILQSQTRNCA